MERWKEILQKDLSAVARGYAEVGKDAGKVNGVISQIPQASIETLAHLLRQNELKHFADKVVGGDYHLVADLEQQGKESESE